MDTSLVPALQHTGASMKACACNFSTKARVGSQLRNWLGISKKRVRNSHMVLCDFTENFEICAICMILNAFSRDIFQYCKRLHYASFSYDVWLGRFHNFFACFPPPQCFPSLRTATLPCFCVVAGVNEHPAKRLRVA